MLTVGSLFSGIGGLELGLERAGMRVLWQVEKDPYALKVLAKHWPNVERFDDVREVGSHNLQTVDLICGGFPCQDVSLAGKRAGLQGERTTLWREFARIIRELRPRWVLAENVPGLLSSDSGMFFGQVLRDLAESGYDAEWQVLPAAAFGAPHKRDRVFIVGYATSEQANQRELREVESSLGRRGETGNAAGLASATVADADRTDGEALLCESDAGILSWRGRLGDGGTSEPWRDLAEQWAVEPAICELAHGFSDRLVRYAGRVSTGTPNRVAKLRCLGNAVVPQVAEWIGRQIVEAECD